MSNYNEHRKDMRSIAMNEATKRASDDLRMIERLIEGLDDKVVLSKDDDSHTLRNIKDAAVRARAYLEEASK